MARACGGVKSVVVMGKELEQGQEVEDGGRAGAGLQTRTGR